MVEISGHLPFATVGLIGGFSELDHQLVILLANCQSGIGKEYEILKGKMTVDSARREPCPCIHTQSQLFLKKRLV